MGQHERQERNDKPLGARDHYSKDDTNKDKKKLEIKELDRE